MKFPDINIKGPFDVFPNGHKWDRSDLNYPPRDGWADLDPVACAFERARHKLKDRS